MLDSLGCGKAALRSVVETTLDEKFSSVSTEWQWEIAPPSIAPFEVTVRSTYLLERADGRLQIVAYFAHGDIVAELQRRSIAVPTP